MKRITTFFALLSIVALALFAAPMLAQDQQYPFPGYPAEFAPSRTVRIPPPAAPRVPQAKFTKLENAVPNTYIVVLEDDEVSNKGTATERRARVADLARGMLPAGAEIKSVYGTVFRGFSVKLPNEAVAIALSKHPRVEFVQSDGLDGSTTDTQPNAPGGLDRIDQASGLDTNYTYNRTGSGVTVYDLGPGVRTTHEQFGSPSRAFIAADLVAADGFTEVSTCTVTSTSNDCDGHGTSMLGIFGGSTYGVAKGATLKSVKILYLEHHPTNPGQTRQVLTRARTLDGIEWVTDYHNANPTQLEVANLSIQFGSADIPISRAIKASFKAGVTYAISAGNNNTNAQYSPSEVGHYYALVTGAENQTDDTRFLSSDPNQSSDYGSKLALWSPGSNIPSATSGTAGALNSSDTATNSPPGGTSRASAHTAGAVALYLQGRTGMNDCGSHPINGPSSTTTGVAIATCPDRVNQFMMSNSTLNALATTGSGAIGTGSPNRLLFTASIPTTTNFNPIDNHRFFVWQQYGDFFPEVANPHIEEGHFPEDHTIPASPDENGLDWWTSEITGHGHCTAGVNDNNSCTNTWRIFTSRAFWVDQHPELFNTSYGLNSGKNGEFVELCYDIYLQRASDTAGYNHWLSVLNSYGDPSNGYGVVHLIDAFINSPEYRKRFGGS